MSYYPQLNRLAVATKIAGWIGMFLVALVVLSFASPRVHHSNPLDPLYLLRMTLVAVPPIVFLAGAEKARWGSTVAFGFIAGSALLGLIYAVIRMVGVFQSDAAFGVCFGIFWVVPLLLVVIQSSISIPDVLNAARIRRTRHGSPGFQPIIPGATPTPRLPVGNSLANTVPPPPTRGPLR